MVSRLLEAQNQSFGSLHFNASALAGIDMRNLPMPPNMLSSSIEPLGNLESFKKARIAGAHSANSKLSSSIFPESLQQHSQGRGQEFMASSKVSPHLSMLSQSRSALDAGRNTAGEHQSTDLLRQMTGLDTSSSAPSAGALPMLMQQQVNNITTEQANELIQGLTGIQGFWDLEPTPLGLARKGSNEE